MSQVKVIPCRQLHWLLSRLTQVLHLDTNYSQQYFQYISVTQLHQRILQRQMHGLIHILLMYRLQHSLCVERLEVENLDVCLVLGN